MTSACCSAQKCVIVIGVVTGILAAISCVSVVATYITLEDHMQSCKRDDASSASDVLKLLPCELFVNASFALSSRVFLLVQITIWLLLLLFSIMLVMGAVKERPGLLVPWVVLLLIIMGSILYDAVIAGMSGKYISVLVSVVALGAASACLVIIKKYSKQLKRRNKCAEATAAAHLNLPLSQLYCHTPPLLFSVGNSRPNARFVNYADITSLCPDLPPDYATSTALNKIKFESSNRAQSSETTTNRPSLTDGKSKTPLPTNLGVLH